MILSNCSGDKLAACPDRFVFTIFIMSKATLSCERVGSTPPLPRRKQCHQASSSARPIRALIRRGSQTQRWDCDFQAGQTRNLHIPRGLSNPIGVDRKTARMMHALSHAPRSMSRTVGLSKTAGADCGFPGRPVRSSRCAALSSHASSMSSRSSSV